MCRNAFYAALAIALLLVPAAAQESRHQLSGCLTGETGNFTLGAVPSGHNYRLQGNIQGLSAHRNQLVRLRGTLAVPANERQTGTFNVQTVEVLAGSCLALLPPQNPAAIRSETGKVGSLETAIDVTTTETAGRVTPGVQTEAGEAQQPGHYGEGNQPVARGKLAPPEWGQVGQNQGVADLSAAAAERAEEEPGHTLGVNVMPSYANPAQPQGMPGTQASDGMGGTAAPPAPTPLATQNPTAATTVPSFSGPPSSAK